MPTVLVVDDEPVIRKVLARVLEDDGYSVLTAENGVEAISVSRSHRGEIDLLISDVTMPAMDGCTLASELRVENPTLPVLLMSGCCEGAQEARCTQFPFLPKPFSMRSLLDIAGSLIGLRVGCGRS